MFFLRSVSKVLVAQKNQEHKQLNLSGFVLMVDLCAEDKTSEFWHLNWRNLQDVFSCLEVQMA